MVESALAESAKLGAVGVVLHPRRDNAQAVEAIAAWAKSRSVRVLGLAEELDRLRDLAEPVDADQLAAGVDLLVSLGGDGTMLRALRMVDGCKVPVLGVNLGKLGFLAEVDVPDLAAALEAIGRGEHLVETRVSVTADVGGQSSTAYNDVVLARRPGQGMAAVALWVEGKPFVRYSADAIIVSTPTGSTAYNFSAGGPIVSPRAQGLLVTPVAPHSSFNRSLFLSCSEPLALEVLTGSGVLAVEVDGEVRMDVRPGDIMQLGVDLDGGQVVRFAGSSFYDRARRKLRVTDSAELG
ncbi:MAG TPA: NAD(+)/NADH kinase [Pseudonocardia sp.]|nr:NAD(+)/NADH kinase [Pseudonocardia sp.]